MVQIKKKQKIDELSPQNLFYSLNNNTLNNINNAYYYNPETDVTILKIKNHISNLVLPKMGTLTNKPSYSKQIIKTLLKRNWLIGLFSIYYIANLYKSIQYHYPPKAL